jgi:PIN domain
MAVDEVTPDSTWAMTKILHLFPDTNLLIQCRALEELDWERWKEFDEVRLVISRPVQKEIDKHKNGGNERLAKRGKKAASLLRDVIADAADHKVIREADPRVTLFIRLGIRPSEEFAEILNYAEPDDQLVGTAHSFATQNPGCDARILTHDSGPMASAKTVGVTAAVIPDEWLLPPERSESDKRIKALEAEVARLKQDEPAFQIACLDRNGEECDRIELETTCYEPLSDSELAGLMQRLKERLPIATDFGPRERSEREARWGRLSLSLGVKEVFTPASEKEIEEYQKNYASWLEEFEQKLRNFHVALHEAEQSPGFVFQITNEGTRPATDALVTIFAKGRFLIMPPPYRDDDEADKSGEAKRDGSDVDFPSPPDVPRGGWKTDYRHRRMFGDPELLRGLSGVTTLLPGEDPLRGYLGLDLNPPRPRDPNAFYHKPNRPDGPVAEFSVECKQWRHSTQPEPFEGQISFDRAADTVSGALECRVHAGNASETASRIVPVQIKVNHVRAYATAMDRVARLH